MVLASKFHKAPNELVVVLPPQTALSFWHPVRIQSLRSRRKFIDSLTHLPKEPANIKKVPTWCRKQPEEGVLLVTPGDVFASLGLHVLIFKWR